MSDEVAHDPKGIGFIGISYIGKSVAIGISSTCGIASTPSRFSVKTEEYPLARRLYLYTIGTPTDPVAHDLLEFALSDDAQATVQEAEFVDQTIDSQEGDAQSRWAQDSTNDPSRTLGPDKAVPKGAVDAFGRAMEQAHRTTIAFRFEKGSAQLDNRALQDVARLARYLSAPAQAGKRYMIAGFADATGSWAANSRLADERARAVVGELRKAGIACRATASYLSPTWRPSRATTPMPEPPRTGASRCGLHANSLTTREPLSRGGARGPRCRGIDALVATEGSIGRLVPTIAGS